MIIWIVESHIITFDDFCVCIFFWISIRAIYLRNGEKWRYKTTSASKGESLNTKLNQGNINTFRDTQFCMPFRIICKKVHYRRCYLSIDPYTNCLFPLTSTKKYFHNLLFQIKPFFPVLRQSLSAWRLQKYMR